jgi:hypothetical protein
MIDWQPPSVMRIAHQQVAEAALRIRQLEAEVTRLQAFRDAVATIEDQGAAVKRRPGRPRKQEAAA